MDHATIDSLTRSRRFNFGPLFLLDQLHRGAVDLAVNRVSSLEEAKAIDLTTIWNTLSKEVQRNVLKETNINKHAPSHIHRFTPRIHTYSIVVIKLDTGYIYCKSGAYRTYIHLA